MLEAQVRRLIADPRADAMVENFVGQWLQLRNLESRVKPDFLLFPDFDDNLRKSFRRETELLFANVLREGRPVHELHRMRTTRSSTSGWRGTTAFTASMAPVSARSTSRTRTATGYSVTAACSR